MNATNTCGAVEDFPPAARAFLQAFYEAKGVADGNSSQKLDALKEGWGLKDAIVTADGDVSNDDEELRILEFYVLTKRGII
jgi:hypothetical protein